MHKNSDAELVKLFWSAPVEALFGQETIGPVINRKPTSLDRDRWLKSGIPYRKIFGRVLYRKKDVVDYIESHQLIT